jgi:hypothetical protein
MGYNRSGRRFKDRIKRRKILERRLARQSEGAVKTTAAPSSTK